MLSILSRLREPSTARLNHHFAAVQSQRFTQKLFVQERAVPSAASKNVMPRSTAVWRRSVISLLIFGRTIRKAHSHAAEADGRDFQVAVSEFPSSLARAWSRRR